MCSVYGLCSSEDNKTRYIGQTINALDARLKNHIRHARKYRHRYISTWINSVINAGYEVAINPIVENAVWNQTGIRVIAEYKSDGFKLVNGTNGGEGQIGRVWTKEEKKAQSDRMSGKKKTDSHKRALSLANKGKTMSQETRKKISESLHGKRPKNLNSLHEMGRGRKVSDEQKAKISASLKGRQVTSTDKLLKNLEVARRVANG